MHLLEHAGIRATWTGIFALILLHTTVSGCAHTGPLPGPAVETRAEAPTIQASMSPGTSVSIMPSPPAVISQPPARTEPNPTATRAAPASLVAAPTNPSPTATRAAPATLVAAPTNPSPTATLLPPLPATVPATPPFEQISLRLEPVAGGLDRPVLMTHASDGSGRLFIVEKGGTIRIFEQGQLVSRPFLDIRDRVLSQGSEQGLLGMAFSPDFDRTGAFFVDYTDLSGNTVISRFRVTGDANLADPGSEFKVLGIDQPAANHNGGNLVFGPDGYLWVGTGDGGGAGDRFGNGQNPQTLLGKMLRLDVTTDPAKPYTIPLDNPWVTATWNGQAVRPEIWAVGLRNPWRYSFDGKTGDLWVADVGQDLYEEVDLIPAGPGGKLQGGPNFGWSIMEGTHCYPEDATCQRDGLTMPVWDYKHGADGCSITGGYVYRGEAIHGLDGVYLFGDYCSGRMWALTQGADRTWRGKLLLDTGLAISSFGEDEAGEIYVADLKGGEIYRLVAG
jgi:glucose/arabinose dehydrogenase